MPRWVVVLMSAGMLAVSLDPLSAQEGTVTFEFSFSNPGARSMALGGAFAALADDATAAFANPAGLVQLIEPELSVEGRVGQFDTTFVQGGRVSGAPSGEGLDTVAGLRRGVSPHETTNLSYASLVYPTKRVSLALYRHTWADFELESQVNGLFGLVDGEVERSEDVRSRTTVEVINTGLAAGFELGQSFSLGLGVVYFEAGMNTLSQEYAQDEELLFSPNVFLDEDLDTTYAHTADTTGYVFHAGFLWRLRESWSVGGYYRQGPELDLKVVETVGPADDEVPEGTVELDIVTPLALPDVYGLGVAYRSPGGRWTVGLDWSRVLYSSIAESLDATVFDPGQVALDDGDEIHFGLEYVFVRSRPIVGLRFGAWHDPAHSVGSGFDADLFEAAIFQSGSDEIHWTGGLGLVFETFQIDLGVDISDEADLASLSFVYRF